MLESVGTGVAIFIIGSSIIGFSAWVAASLVKALAMLQELISHKDSHAIILADHETRIRELERK